jgi:DnaJ family protein C protein 8
LNYLAPFGLGFTFQFPRPSVGRLESNKQHISNQMSDLNDSGKDQEEWEINRDYHKKLADDAFRSREFSRAIEEYSLAISFDPDNHILFSNRSASYLSNNERSKALSDAKKCVELVPNFVKGHSRLAASLQSLQRYNEAISVFEHILSLDGENENAKKGIEDCKFNVKRKKEQEAHSIKQTQKEQDGIDTTVQQDAKENGDNNSEDDEDDLLNSFFDEVDESIEKKPVELEEPPENKIQIQVSDLGDVKTQIKRLLCPHHEWYNLNPYRVLDISHHASEEILTRRYKALSLLLHPDKIRSSNDNDTIKQAEEAFEYVRKAMESLKDESKRTHFINLIEEGIRKGKKDYEKSDHSETLDSFQNKAVMKIFAEIERKRLDVERRQRNQEQRERSQEDAEVEKMKKEQEFDKHWKESHRVEKRIGNWRDFSKTKRPKN